MAKRILVLGAAGLIGSFVCAELARRGHQVVPVARRFTAAQRELFGATLREAPIVSLDAGALTRLLDDSDIVVNCVGVLQNRPGAHTHDVHDAFAEKLIAALRALERPVLLVHVSIPGEAGDDRTDFSITKREADKKIAASGLPYAILRPGFVWAPAAFGGSALLRALAALPLALPAFESSRPFGFVAVEDVAETVAVLAERWTPEQPEHAAVWDLMHPDPSRVGDVFDALRRWLGATWLIRYILPASLLGYGARAGDLSVLLGWAPPIRTTAIAEMRRGVEGDPRPWMEATGIAPRSLASLLLARPADVQEKWFARLYLLKALVIVSLAIFWCASGLTALTLAYPAAVAILTSHHIPNGWAQAMTVASSLIDIAIGLAIAVRRTSRLGLAAGIAVSLFYMLGAVVLTPELWIEPIGALVKTGPAIVLMLVALAISDER